MPEDCRLVSQRRLRAKRGKEEVLGSFSSGAVGCNAPSTTYRQSVTRKVMYVEQNILGIVLGSLQLGEQETSNGEVPGTGLVVRRGLRDVLAEREVCAPAALSEGLATALILSSPLITPQSMWLPLDPPFLCPSLGNRRTHECGRFQVCSRRVNSEPQA